MKPESVLLDTHVWIWLLQGATDRLGERAVGRIERALRRRAAAISDISLWEVSVKAAKGKLSLLPNTETWLQRAQQAPGIGILQLDRNALLDSTRLDFPGSDPADRILLATALQYDLPLVTADSAMLEYGERHRRPTLVDARL